MASNIDIRNTVTLHNDHDYLTIGQIREFAKATESFGSETKVKLQMHNGQRDPFVKMEATLGDLVR